MRSVLAKVEGAIAAGDEGPTWTEVSQAIEAMGVLQDLVELTKEKKDSFEENP